MNENQAAGSTTMRAGTPSFQAPEQLRGENLTDKCDVYALGGVITELFGERPLWSSLSVHQVMYKVGVEGLYPSVEHLPAAVKTIVETCFTSATVRANVGQVLCQFLDLENLS